MRLYRKAREFPKPKVCPERPPNLARLLAQVKNSAAVDLKAFSASVFLISNERVKNILATTEIILIAGLPET